MNKEIQYTYDEVDFRERMKLLTRLYVQQEQSKIGNYVVFLVMSTLLGVAFLYFNADGPGIVIGPILLLVGLIYGIALVSFFVRKRRFEQNFDKNFDEIIQQLNEVGGIIRYSFFDDHLIYHEGDNEIKLNWEHLHSFLHIGKYLYLMIEKGNTGALTLSATDIPQAEFDQICAFVKTKLHPHAFSKLEEKKRKVDNNLLDS